MLSDSGGLLLASGTDPKHLKARAGMANVDLPSPYPAKRNALPVTQIKTPAYFISTHCPYL